MKRVTCKKCGAEHDCTAASPREAALARWGAKKVVLDMRPIAERYADDGIQPHKSPAVGIPGHTQRCGCGACRMARR